MTDQEINIAIGEACGWQAVQWEGRKDTGHAIGVSPKQPDKQLNDGPAYTIVPDYCNDLNAMHEAEKILSITKDDNFFLQLVMVARKSGSEHGMNYRVVHATARERAEAFLRAIGKWRD